MLHIPSLRFELFRGSSSILEGAEGGEITMTGGGFGILNTHLILTTQKMEVIISIWLMRKLIFREVVSQSHSLMGGIETCVYLTPKPMNKWLGV